MNFLCICQYGHSRSVALCRVLHSKGQPAVAVGVGTGGTAVIPLAQWADKILVLQPSFASYVPAEHRAKIVDFDVGPDRWSNPYNADLLALLATMVQERLGL